MKTIVRYNKLGCYDFAHPSDKSESFVLMFDKNDRKNKTVVFRYDEDDAPRLDINDLSVIDLIDELEDCPSKRSLYSSSYNHIEEKTHDERIKIARGLAEINAKEDDKEYVDRLIKRAENLEERARKLRKTASYYLEDNNKLSSS